MLNVAPLRLGNQALPREHEPTPIGSQQLDANVHNKTREKNRGKKEQDLTICEVHSMFLALSNLNVTADEEHYVVYLIWYCI